MIKRGPVDVVVLAAGNPRFEGRVFTELERQVAAGTIRVLDAMLLVKDEAAQCRRLELKDLPPEQSAAVGFVAGETRGLFDATDARDADGGHGARLGCGRACDRTHLGDCPRERPRRRRCRDGLELPCAGARCRRGICLAARESLEEADMPGLMRGMARTAAVVGTATATRNAVNRRQADKNAQAYANAQAQAAPPPQACAAAAGVCTTATCAAGPRRRCDHAARAPGRAQGAGTPDRRGVRRPEGQAARHVGCAGPRFARLISNTVVPLYRYLGKERASK